MKRIGLLSDTHGYFDPALRVFFSDCDEIWHAGDIGDEATADEIESFKPMLAVYGNIDGTELRQRYPHDNRFTCEEANIWITHIGGYPGNYDRRVRESIRKFPPDLFISGHSHICKVMHDNQTGLLHINPGAAGKKGFHEFRTAVRFTIEGKKIKDLEIYEISR